MKNIIKIIFAGVLITAFGACKKEENKVRFLGGEAPTLTLAAAQQPVLLTKATKSETAVLLKWTNPGYKFSTGISSQDVNYTLQFDKEGAGFSSAGLQEKSLSKDLEYTLTQEELNNIMAKLDLDVDQPHKVEVRVKANLSGGAGNLVSNAVSFTAIPYLDVAVPLPSTGNLYIIGSATPGDWNQPVPEPSQVFTKVDETTYAIEISLKGGMEYLILPENGSWANKYAVKLGDNPPSDLWMGGDFGYNWSDNIPGPPESGTYRIELFFKTGKFTVTKL